MASQRALRVVLITAIIARNNSTFPKDPTQRRPSGVRRGPAHQYLAERGAEVLLRELDPEGRIRRKILEQPHGGFRARDEARIGRRPSSAGKVESNNVPNVCGQYLSDFLSPVIPDCNGNFGGAAVIHHLVLDGHELGEGTRLLR